MSLSNKIKLCLKLSCYSFNNFKTIINPYSQGYDVFAIGVYDVKFDGSSSNYATDLRYERRFDNTLIDIGPEEDNFFYLKPFAGIELTSDSALYLISGIYLRG